MTQHNFFANPAEEYKKAQEVIQNLQEYQQKNWGIGLNGETFQPDHFLQYFTQRNIPFQYYVVNKGVTIGNNKAYQQNIKAIQNYVEQMQKQEEQQCNHNIQELHKYEQNYWAIGLNGDTLQPDNFNTFFAERNLPFFPYVRSTSGVQIGEHPTYRQNIETLTKYLAELGVKVKEMTTTH